MLDQYIWTRIRTWRFKISAIIITTIILLTAAGSSAAAFSFQESLIDLFGIKPIELFASHSKKPKVSSNQTNGSFAFLSNGIGSVDYYNPDVWVPIAARSVQAAFPAPPPAPTFGYNYTVATSSNGFDATVDSLGNLYSAYESGGNIYLKKNLGEAELVSAGSGPAIAIDSSNSIHIIYANSGLKYKKKTGAVWGTERAVNGGTVFYSIDTDSTGAAHIASDDGGTGGRGHIVYVKDEGGTWSSPIIELTGYYDSGSGNYFHLPVIRIGNGDKYHLAYEADYWGGGASFL